jgi:UDP-N-acetylglucosamine--N-acetylmuramyl-(pentapeptide) pyrophosphoryl-undecaprenol N-acetylglucosamine transferase
VLAKAGAAVLMPQAEATPEALAERISDWLEQPLSLTNMARAARGSAQPDATQRVVSVLQEVAHASV